MYFFHLRDKVIEEQIAADVEKLGGAVSSFLTSDVKVVVTDYPSVDLLIDKKKRAHDQLATTDKAETAPETQAADEQSTSTQARVNGSLTQGKLLNGASTSNLALSMLRGKMKLRAGQTSNQDPKSAIPNILKEANRMGLKIVRCSDFLRQLAAQKRKNKSLFPHPAAPAKRCPLAGRKSKMFRLAEPFVKLEDRGRQYRPVFEELSAWPRITVTAGRKGCVFAEDKITSSQNGQSSSSPVLAGSPKKKRKAARKLYFDETNQKRQIPDGAGLTTATDSKVLGEDREARPGFCELCDVNADNIAEHLSSEEHRKNSSSNIYERLDEEIAKGTTLEQFLDMVKRGHAENKRSGAVFHSPKPPSSACSPAKLASLSRLQLPLQPPLSSSSPQRSFNHNLRSPRNRMPVDPAKGNGASPCYKFTRDVTVYRRLSRRLDLTAL